MILIIDNYDSFTYNLYQSIAVLYPEVKVIRNDKITVAEIQKMAPRGIILSPGPGRPEDAGICVDLIQSHHTNIPLLGVCLGHQAIGLAFGGKVVGAPTIMHGKKEMIFHHRRGLYQDLPLPFAAARYHSLVVDRPTLPNVLQVEAQTSNGIIMGMRHQQLPIYGVQFHPESILTPQGDKLLQQFVKECQK